MADFASSTKARAFSFGAIPASALSARLHLADSAAKPAAAALHAAASAATALRDALLADTSPSASDFALWAERITPIDVEELPPPAPYHALRVRRHQATIAALHK
eukprot:4640409-Pleurochrysis_carterae.AAC.1